VTDDVVLSGAGARRAKEIKEISDCQNPDFYFWRDLTFAKDYPKVRGKHRYAKVWNKTRKFMFKALNKSRRAAANGNEPKADKKAQKARNALYKGTRKFIDLGIPDEQVCEAYRDRMMVLDKLLYLSGLDSCPIQTDLDRVLTELDEDFCGGPFSGLWSVKPISGFQTCRTSDGSDDTVEWTEDEGGPETYLLELEQDGLELFGFYPELDGTDLSGELSPLSEGGYSFLFEIESTEANPSPDCQLFMESNGTDTVFGSPFCEGFPCMPKSCRETEQIVGEVYEDTRLCPPGTGADFCASIRQSWRIGVTYIVDGDRELSVECEGMAQSLARKFDLPLVAIPTDFPLVGPLVAIPTDFPLVGPLVAIPN
jgi:hypothetical protein